MIFFHHKEHQEHKESFHKIKFNLFLCPLCLCGFNLFSREMIGSADGLGQAKAAAGF